MSGKKGTSASSQEAQQLMQVLQAQSSMQALLLASYSRAFQTCTTSSSYGTLSTKEKRCLQQMISNDIEARSLIAQHIAAQHQASGKDF